MPTRVTRRVLAGRLLRDWQRAGGQGTRSPGTQGVFPHAFTITPWMSWSAESGNTPSRAASTSAVGLGLVRTTTSAIDDTIEWNVEMAAGTWSIRFIYVTHSGGGTHAVKIDGTTFATLDTYSAGDVYNVTSTTTAVAVASSGIHVLSSVCTGKHASSADEDYIYTAISGVKTA